MSDPVDTLVRINPVHVSVETPGAPGQTYEDALSAGDDYIPGGGPAIYPLTAALSRVTTAGLIIEGTAWLTIRAEDMPPNVKPDTCQVVAGPGPEDIYTVKSVRTRYWKGAINGYTLAVMR